MGVYLGENLVDAFGGTKNIGDSISLQTKEINPTESIQYVTADSNYDGLEVVQVNAISNTYIGSGIKKKNASSYTPNNTEQVISSGQYLNGDQIIESVPTESKTITTNGTYSPSTGMYFDNIVVDVDDTPILQEKTVTPNESIQSVSPDSGYDGLNLVTVNAISPNYVGSNIINRTSKDLSVSGASVTVPSGYYSAESSKSVSVVNQAVPNISVDSSGLIISSVTQNTGYVNGDTVTTTKQLVTKDSETYMPNDKNQIITSGIYLTGNQVIAPVPTESKSITSNGTYTPTTGKYFNSVTVNVSTESGGIDTSDADAVASDIIENKTAYVNGQKITGSMTQLSIDTDYNEPTVSYNQDSDKIQLDVSPKESNSIKYIDGNIILSASSNEFGNATPSDVISGKTFTSSSGLKVIGTHIEPSPILQSKTVIPSESEQITTADNGYDGLNEVAVSAISSTYIGSAITRNTASNITTNENEVNIPSGYYSENITKSIDSTILATPTISIDSNGLITAIESQVTSGYISASTKTSTKQLNTKPSTDYTPGDNVQTIEANTYLTGVQTINAVPVESKEITTNGTYVPSTGKYFNSVTVNINDTPILQEKTISPAENTQIVSFDDGYDGLNKVTVDAVSSTYIGSNITRNNESNLTINGSTVNVPSGYYENDVSKSINTTTLATPSISVDSNGLIVATENQETSGYIESTTKSTTHQLTTKNTATYTPNDSIQTIPSGIYLTGTQTITAVQTESKTVTPSVSEQSVSPSSGKYLSSVTVEAIPTTVQATPIISVSTNGLITSSATQSEGYVTAGTKSATSQLDTLTTNTYVPTTIDQTISSGKYITGTQTIKGDSNLVSDNILSGVSIFGVNGSVIIQKYYTGSEDPESTLGNDGDLYLKVGA